MQRLTLIARLTLLAGALALIGCPGNTPQLDPKYLTSGSGGGTGSGGCTPSLVPAVCARGADGLRCALSDGVSALGPSTVWEPGLSDPDWAAPERYETIA